MCFFKYLYVFVYFVCACVLKVLNFLLFLCSIVFALCAVLLPVFLCAAFTSPSISMFTIHPATHPSFAVLCSLSHSCSHSVHHPTSLYLVPQLSLFFSWALWVLPSCLVLQCPFVSPCSFYLSQEIFIP